MGLRLTRFFWRLPKTQPTVSALLSGIGGLCLLALGANMVLSPTTSTHGQTSVEGGLVIMLVGLATVGLVVYAAIDTHFFRAWARPSGNYGHAIVRWAGPLYLFVAAVEIIIVLWIFSVFASGYSRRYRW